MPVSAPYDDSACGLTRLRAQVYLMTPGPGSISSGGSLIDDELANASLGASARRQDVPESRPAEPIQPLRCERDGSAPGRQPPESSTTARTAQCPRRDRDPGPRRALHLVGLGYEANTTATESICVVRCRGLGRGSEYGET